MSRIGKIVRRTFLIGTAAIAGGVAFGVYQVRKPAPNPLSPGEGETALNPFVLIDQQGVTVIAPRAEMGQGVRTTLAALVAEELDLAWEDIRVIHGPPGQAYFNSALLGLGLPFRDYAVGDFQHGLKETVGEVGKLFSLQVTGGSTSMIDGFERMREAGATARETLKLAAAERLGVGVDRLGTRDGAVIAPDGTAIPYPQLAEAAALIDPPAVTLRDPSTWKYLGKSMPRVDMVEKSTGTAEFGIDVRVPGMKFAALRVNPKLGGKMISADTAEAEAMPGVEKVIRLDNGIAVVASNTWLAMQAAEAARIEWENAPYPATTDAIFAKIAASFDTEANSTMRDDGDVTQAVEGGTEVTAEYTVPFLAHATMEPMNATAHFTGDALTVWCGNQAPVIVQQKCAEAAGLDPDAVTLHTTYLGGGFGRRGEYDYAVYATRVAVEMPGTPVKLTWSREEDMRHDYYRPGAMARFRGVVRDGTAVTLDGAIAAPSVSHQSSMRLAGFVPPGPDKGHVEAAFDQPYAIPNYRISGHLTDLAVPIGFWRAVGSSFNGFFFDSFIDEMAHAAGADPLDFRVKLIEREHAPSAGTLRRVAEMSGWTGKTPDGVGRGVGFSYSFGTPVAEVVEVVDEDGAIRIARAWIACDVGIALDPAIVRAQMESGLIFGLSAAMSGKITFADGEVEQWNYPDYDALRMHNAPRIEVDVLETNAHLGGAGEPGTPPAMPALANAVFDLTGTRARQLPLSHQFDFIL